MTVDGTFYIYRGTDGYHRWRLRDRNNEIIAVSGEWFVSEYSAERSVQNVISTVRGNVQIVKL